MLIKWAPFHLSIKRQIIYPLSSLVFPKPSVTAAHLSRDEHATSTALIDTNRNDPVCGIVANIKNVGFKRLIDLGYLRNTVLSLSESQFDQIFYCLRVESPNYVVAFFDWLNIEFGFKLPPVSRFIVSHVLAGERRFKELRSVLEQMLRKEGIYFFLYIVIFFIIYICKLCV